MKRYGIADIGSNTMVLIVYHLENGKPIEDKYISTPAHLIQYVDQNRCMSEEGIRTAMKVLLYYDSICENMHCDYKWADITEPCRITNADELVNALDQTGFEIFPLSGEEEASCDFIGAKLSYPEIHEGAAFDVGGGSTELIVYENDRPLAAASFHLGCVRLAALPLVNEDCHREILAIQQEYPALAIQADTLIGIGGTARAARNVMDGLYQCGNTINVEQLREVFTRIRDEEPEAVNMMKEKVDASRQKVFLPGLHMILEICAVYGAKTIIFSPSGIREGFLMERIRQLA